MTCQHKWTELRKDGSKQHLTCDKKANDGICQHCEEHCPSHLGVRRHLLDANKAK